MIYGIPQFKKTRISYLQMIGQIKKSDIFGQLNQTRSYLMANLLEPNCLDCECKSICFQELSVEELEFLSKKRIEVTYKKGETIAKQGAFAPHILYVKEGLVKVYLEHQNRNLILCLEPPGTFLGLESLYQDKIFHFSAVTYDNSNMCLFEIDAFKHVMENNARFATRIYSQLNERIVRVYDRMLTLTQKQVHGRVADIFKCLSERIYKSNEFPMSLTRKDFSEITVMSVETLSRVFKELKDEGVIDIDGKNVKILDVDKLNQISRTS